MPNLEWNAAAVSDLLAIVDYISDDNPDAAQVLKDDIEDKTSRLPEHPQMYREGRVDGTREMVVQPRKGRDFERLHAGQTQTSRME